MFNIDLKVTKFNSPYNWVNITDLFTPEDGKLLAEDYPTDNYRTITANSNRQYNYDVRALVSFKGKVENSPNIWNRLGEYLVSQEYKNFILQSTDIDVAGLPVEANIYKYAKNCFMDAHTDLDTKVLTHVIYFNNQWDENNGGCLNILKSKDIKDVTNKITPVIGNAVILIRSNNSWHSVEQTTCDKSRRSVTVTFYKKGSGSPMWRGEKYNYHSNTL